MALARPLGSSQKAKRTQSVMETNSSSIASKRSVERLYYPKPHFFRDFVPKAQRRSPLINRGYWLRMHAVNAVVRQFVEESSFKKKVVLNLGCGYDTLAFQWLSKIKETAHNITFIDVDFPELVAKKSQIVCSTLQFRELLRNLETPPNDNGVILRSKDYYAVGCDLGDIEKLDELLASLLDLSKCLVLFIAEVSLTYMDIDLADSLVAWGARQVDAQFCLLEQYLPDGTDHPFARKMIQHFSNLHTPLKSIGTYPRLSDQVQRFSGAGWNFVDARSLWEIFHSPGFVSYKERVALDEVEPFDEWEELILFASHYFLLVARKCTDRLLSPTSMDESSQASLVASIDGGHLVHASVFSNHYPGRKFGTIVKEGYFHSQICHVGGMGPQTRTATTNIYVVENETETGSETEERIESKGKLIEGIDRDRITMPSSFEPRMCHSAKSTEAFEGDWLLVGGRKSPDQAMKDCWLLQDSRWRRVDDLPIPLYRHCQTRVLLSQGIEKVSAFLVYGGKTLRGDVSDKWLLWRESAGWVELMVDNVQLIPRFGAAIVTSSNATGALIGGMTRDGTICHDFLLWTIAYVDGGRWKIQLTEPMLCKERSDIRALQYVYRFGASLELLQKYSPDNPEKITYRFLLIGGVADKIIPECYEMIEIGSTISIQPTDKLVLVVQPLVSRLPSPRPLLVGHSSLETFGQIIIIGGGAVCFSFGAHWNTAPISLLLGPHVRKAPYIIRPFETLRGKTNQSITEGPSIQLQQTVSEVTGPSFLSAKVFETVTERGQPVVSRNVELGPCLTEWQSLDTVIDRVGSNRVVVVHLSNHSHMDFQQKNFEYVKKPFGSFVNDFKRGYKQYLRSLASDDPARKPADLALDFPLLATDFRLLDQLKMVTNKIHSSVLRISGFVNMWLHYDVMANMLCQIRGTKRLILFPPSDVSHLSVSAGSSTSSVDCFRADLINDPTLAKTHPREVFLQPGDIIYIPPLWLHTASPTLGVSISVNVFFRNLESGYAPGKDVYGNRDVQAYEKGRQDIEKLTRSFDELPWYMRSFYLDRLADELKEKASQQR